MKWLPLLLGIALLQLGCAPERGWKTPDPWFNAPAAEPNWSEPIDGTRIDTVLDSKEPDAEEMLAERPFVEISPEQAQKLIGLPLRPHGAARPYLVRGVYLNRGTGVFQIYKQPRGGLMVSHESIGSHTTTMKRQALVVELDEVPRQVFVVCRMTEMTRPEPPSDVPGQ